MDQLQIVLGAVVPVFGIALLGLLIRKLDWLTEEADRSLLRVNINLLFPCLILDSALGNPALSQVGNLLLAPLVGFLTVAGGFYISRECSRLLRLRQSRSVGTFALTVGLYNYGYVPLPLAMTLFGSGTAAVLFVHNVGVELAMWTLGVMLLTGGSGQDWKKIVNAPLVAVLLAIVLNATGGHIFLPDIARQILQWLGQCAIPMALILIGAVIADHLSELHSGWDWRVIGIAVLLRLVLFPMAFLLIAKHLPASVELKRVIVLEAAMPSAVFPIIMTRHYGGDPAMALRVVLSTSVIGLVTIPLWIRFGLTFVGL
jgi:malate permease and related proteins